MAQEENKSKKQFHRHFATPGQPLYWIIIAYILLGWFFPVVGLAAIICMIGPVLFSIWRGRWWCGNVCPRGNLYSQVLSKYSPHRPIPKFVRTFGFRLFMVFFIFTMFGIQLSFVPWSQQSILDNHRGNHHRRHSTGIHLCTTHLVLVLSHGNHLQLGST